MEESLPKKRGITPKEIKALEALIRKNRRAKEAKGLIRAQARKL